METTEYRELSRRARDVERLELALGLAAEITPVHKEEHSTGVRVLDQSMAVSQPRAADC
jgi:hypothetical protein